jgi:signal peptidase I
MPPASVRRGDVVVFHDPVDDPSVHLVKRVIGLPGDSIRMRNRVVYVNGRPLEEAYTVYSAAPPDGYRDDFPNLSQMDGRVDPAWWIRLRGLVRDGEMTVPQGDYFVLGDNRNDSDDSRYWGFVPRGNIVGVPVVVYFSWDEARPAAAAATWHDRLRDSARWNRIFHVVR